MAKTSQSEDAPAQILSFTLRGGPLHRLERRLGLADGRSSAILMGVGIGVFLWIVLVGLALVEGGASRLFSISVLAGHLRILVAIPLFFVCEAEIIPRMTTFFRVLNDSEIVSANSVLALNREIARAARWRDTTIPEAVCLILAISLLFTSSKLHFAGSTADFSLTGITQLGWTAAWYWLVCLTVFRFLLIRWIWRLMQWTYVLWRLSRLELHLVPTHPDCAGGLGYLEVVHIQFVPLVLALSSVQCAARMESLSGGTIAPTTAYMTLALVVAMEAVLFIGPLLVFWGKLWDCRENGLADYMIFAGRYVNDFEKKWIGARPDDPVLGTPDLQSLADLFNSMTVVRNMRFVPFGLWLPASLLAAALAPAIPLLLLVYPFNALAKKLLEIFLGI